MVKEYRYLGFVVLHSSFYNATLCRSLRILLMVVPSSLSLSRRGSDGGEGKRELGWLW